MVPVTGALVGALVQRRNVGGTFDVRERPSKAYSSPIYLTKIHHLIHLPSFRRIQARNAADDASPGSLRAARKARSPSLEVCKLVLRRACSVHHENEVLSSPAFCAGWFSMPGCLRTRTRERDASKIVQDLRKGDLAVSTSFPLLCRWSMPC